MSTAILNSEKKKTLVPQLRFQEFDGEWEEIKLGKLAEKIGDGLHGTPIYSDDSDINFINGNNLTNGKIEITDKTKKVDYAIFLKNDKGLNENTILISLNGTIGNIAKYNNEKVMLGKSVGYFNFKENIDFYFHVFHTDKIQNFFISELTGSTIKNLSLKTLRETVFPIPSVPEQQKIASFLSAVDEKIQQLTRKATLLEQYKKGVMQQLFSGKLRFKDENGEDYPEWDEQRLGNLTFKVGKKNKENIQYPIYSINNKEGFLPQSEQFDGLDSNDRGYDISLYKIVESETFAYNPARINVGSIGYSYDLKKVIVSSLYVCFKTVDILEDLYLLAYLDTYNFKKDILRFEEGGVRQYLFYENFSLIKIPLPSNKEQQKIANFLSGIDSKIEKVNQQLAQTKTFKKGLLQQMFV